MGYEIHITRAEDWAKSPERPISLEEWRQYVTDDPELIFAGGVNPPNFAVFKDEPPYGAWLDWICCEVYSKAPSSRMLLKMLEVAKKLGAKVQGDDQEVYTEGSAILEETLTWLRNDEAKRGKKA